MLGFHGKIAKLLRQAPCSRERPLASPLSHTSFHPWQAAVVHKMVRHPLISGSAPVFRGHYKKLLQLETQKLIKVPSN